MLGWSDIDIDAFRRLCEFSYDGDYTPLQTQRAAQNMSGRDALSHLVRPGGIGEAPGMNAPGGIYAATAHSYAAAAANYPAPGQIDATSAHNYIPVFGYTAAASEGASATRAAAATMAPGYSYYWKHEDFLRVVLGQARIYVLAAELNIKSLCTLVIARLSESLKTFRLHGQEGVYSIIDLIHFVYENMRAGTPDNTDPLRKLMIGYVKSIQGHI